MDKIDANRFKKADSFGSPSEEKKLNEYEELSEVEFDKLLERMKDPAKIQREMAVKMKNYLDIKIEKELREKGILSDHTRRWVETFNSTLEKIQRALHSDKGSNLGKHKVSHSDIANKIREAENGEITS